MTDLRRVRLRAAAAMLGPVVVGSVLGGPVAAQEQAATAESGLDTILVTAQRRAQSIQDVPVAVSAFDMAALERINMRDIRDLTGMVPNMVLTEVAIGPSMSQISLRGVNSQDPEKSFDPAVGVFVDGVYLGTSAFNLLDSFDLERLEILRGPQGTLFGRNTTGGAINAFRTRPTGELGVRARAIVGTADRLDLNAVVNLPEIGDALSLKLSGFTQKDDGLWENPAGGATGAKDRWGLTGTAMLKVGLGEVIVTYDHFRDDSELTPYFARGVAATEPLPFPIIGTPPVPATVTPGYAADILCVRAQRCDNPSDRRSRVTDPHRQQSTLDALTVQGTFDLSDQFTLETVLGWRQSREDVFIDFDGTDLTVFNVYRGQDYEQMSAEARVASNFSGPINFVAGLFWFENRYALRQAIKLDVAMTGAPVPLGLLYVNGAGDEDIHRAETFALFAQADWAVSDTVTLTLGGRGSWDRKAIRTAFFGPARGVTDAYDISEGVIGTRPLTSSGAASERWFRFTPRVAMNWQPGEDLLVYASYSRGYNAGGFSARAGTVADVTTPFDPEFIDAFEVGAKADLADGRLRLNGALFWNEYRDKQEEAIEPGPPPTFTSTTVRNVSAARIRGLELELSALPADFLRIDASLGLLDAEYTDYQGFVGAGQFVSVPPQPAGTLLLAELSGLTLRRTPDVTASVMPVFTFDLGPGRLEVNGAARFVDAQVVEFFNSPRGRIPATWIFDAAASFTFGGPTQDLFRVSLFGRNLSDQERIGSFTNSLVDFSTTTVGRTWGLEFLVNF